MLGLALIAVDKQSGAKTCFRYPLPPSDTRSASSVFSAERAGVPGFGRTLLSLPEQFFRLEGDFFAKLFNPQASLCNQVFQMEMDDLLFISHPVIVPHKDQGAQSPTDGKAVHERQITLFNVIFAIDYDLAKETTRRSKNQGGAQEHNTDFSEYKHAAHQLAMTLKWEEDRCSYVSEQVYTRADLIELHELIHTKHIACIY